MANPILDTNSDKNFANQLEITITDLFPSLLLIKSFAKNRKLCHIFFGTMSILCHTYLLSNNSVPFWELLL